MRPRMVTFLKTLAFCYAVVVLSWLCGYAVVGLFISAVAVGVGFLQIWDWVDLQTKDCWLCGREPLTGRHLYAREWYHHEGQEPFCRRCSEPLVQPGDRLYGDAMETEPLFDTGRKAA